MKFLSHMALLGLAMTVAACGLPTNQMTPAERRADMEWAFTVFQHNYAPVELKKSNFGVDISQVEASCVSLAQQDMDNQAFLALFQKCLRSFHDAHVGGQQMNNGLLPEYANVAHLGFFTMRTKIEQGGKLTEALRIITLLKGSDTPGAPLIPGDAIVEVNGISVEDYLLSELVPYVNVGQDETNLSLAAFRFGVRTSIDMALPTEDTVQLKVLRGASVFDIELPWIKEDMLAFQLKQNPPEEEEGDADQESKTVPNNLATQGLMPINPLANGFFGYNELKNLFELVKNPAEAVLDRVKLIAQTGFKVARFNPIMRSLLDGQYTDGSSLGTALSGRVFPMAAGISDLMAEPMFTAKVVTTEQGQNYAYIQLSNFPADDKILSEWYRAITAIEDKGIKSVVIDLIDNGGGSLIHGMRMLNMIRKKTIELPTIQVRLNNTWMTSFKTQAAFGADDYSKAIAAKVVRDLETDQNAGKKISRPLSVKVLDPFFLQNPSYGLDDDVKIAILVNEFCVSMCDIFAGVFQDNAMGTVVGSRTMGGGGNVTQHGLSPVAKLGIALTESLILTPKGQYIEDQGITPDVPVDMVIDRETGFEAAFQAALDAVLPAPPASTRP